MLQLEQLPLDMLWLPLEMLRLVQLPLEILQFDLLAAVSQRLLRASLMNSF